MNEKEFVVGQKWLTRDGDVVTITFIAGDPDVTYKVVSDADLTYDMFGREWGASESPTDLISLVEEITAAPAPQEIALPVLSPETIDVLRRQVVRLREEILTVKTNLSIQQHILSKATTAHDEIARLIGPDES